MMRLIVGVSILMLTLSAIAAAQSTWSSFVADASTPYTVENNVVARFTPDDTITVTRFELHSAFSSTRADFNLGQYVQCTKPVSFELTDGTKSYTLVLPGPPALPVPFESAPGTNFSSFADSGPLNLRFSRGKILNVLVLQGDPLDSSGSSCLATATNITVQYRLKDR